MVSFVPAAGGVHGRTATERAVALCEATRLFTLAESLGGVESLIEVPAAMTHMSVASSPLAVDPALVRLSVGIEAPTICSPTWRRRSTGRSAAWPRDVWRLDARCARCGDRRCSRMHR